MEFGKLTFEEIREAAGQHFIAIIPTGCTEQQGPHLPVDFDTWFAYELCTHASDQALADYRIPSVVLPALPFGPTPEHRGFGAGFIDLPQSLHENIVCAVLESLFDQGFRRFLVWQGCGQHNLSQAVSKFSSEHTGQVKLWLPDPPFFEVWNRVGNPEIPGGHADSFTTSIAMFLRPEDVRIKKIRPSESDEVDWDNSMLDFSNYSSTGVIGDPSGASVELGEELWDELVSDVALIIKDFDDNSS